MSGLAAGTYSVTVTDANGCTDQASFTITQPTELVATGTTVNVNCFGDETGSIDLSVSGGTAPYTYLYSDGSTGQDLAGLGAGTYTVTVTDANGCTDQASFTISEFDELVVTGTTTDVDCNGSLTGSIDITVTGGVAPFTYAWSNGATSADLTGLAAGTYTVTVTDANGCTATNSTSFTINQPPAIVLTGETSPADCNGEASGSIDLTVSGGTSPFSYNWSNGATTQNLNGLGAGTYTVTVTDANECTANASFTITQPEAITVTGVTTDTDCNSDLTGSIDITVMGGTAPFTYQWTNGATTEDLTGIPAGTYTVTVTDANECTATATATFTVNQPPVIEVTGTTLDVDCNGNATGEISVMVNGGTPPFSYLWNTGATTATLTGLTAGTYTVTVTDANGCNSVQSFELDEPDLIILTITPMDVLCHGGSSGSATCEFAGGTPPFMITWSDGQTGPMATGLSAGTYMVTVTDGNGCMASSTVVINEPPPLMITTTVGSVACNDGTNTGNNITPIVTGGTPPYTFLYSNGSTDSLLIDAPPGTYTITVTDANNCTEVTPPIVIIEIPLLECEVTVLQLVGSAGNDGQVSVIVTGGTAPYSYLWNTGATTPSITNLGPGTYSVTVTDANGCTTICEATLAAAPGPCEDPVTNPGTIGFDQFLCGPGNDPAPLVELTPASGGSGTIEYLWMYNTVNPNQPINFWTPIPNTNTVSYDPGPLTQTTFFTRCVRRADDCPFIESNIVEIEVGNLATGTINGPVVICENGTGVFTAQNVTPGSTITWEFTGPVTSFTTTGNTATVSYGNFGNFLIRLTISNAACTATITRALTIVQAGNPIYCTGSLTASGQVNNLQQRNLSIMWDLPNDGTAADYTIMRSYDGVEFTAVGLVMGEWGTVNGSRMDYEFEDVTPVAGRNFYRVVMTDDLGNSVTSNTVELMLSPASSSFARIFPNPIANNIIHVELMEMVEDDAVVPVRLISSNGEIVQSTRINTATGMVNIPLARNTAGLYLVQIVTPTGNVETHKVIIK